MAKYPILYPPDADDFFTMGQGPITTSLTATVAEERNGSFIFEAEVLTDDAVYPLLEHNSIIKADAGHNLKDQRFRIKRIVPTSDGKATIYAEHVSYLSQELSLKPEIGGTSVDANAAINLWKSNLNETNPFVTDSDISTVGSFKWRIDKVANPRQALGGVTGSLIDIYGGEYRFDNYHISLLKKRGTTANTVLAYGRNITSLEQEKNITSTYTSVYPYAVYTDGDEKERVVTIDGYTVHCANVASFPNRVVKSVDFSGEFEHNEVPTKAKLKTLAEKYVKDNDFGIPSVSIKVSFLDLSKTADYADYQALEEVNLCDDVRVVFPKLGVDTVAKVTRTVWNVLSESYDEIEIGERRASLSTIINDQGKKIDKAESNSNEALVSANGKNTTFYGLYGPDGLGEPKANKVGDLWYKPNGDETEMYQWNGTVWEFIMSTAPDPELIQAIEEVGEKVEQAQSDADQALTNANDAVDKANQAAAKADASGQAAQLAIEQSANAVTQAQQAIKDAADLLDSVTELSGTIADITVDVDTINKSLAVKVDQTEFNKLKGTVTNQSTLIEANAQAIIQKASQTSVDTLNDTVESVQSELKVEAGKISALNTLTDGHTTQIGSLQTGYDGLSSTVALVQNRFTDGNNLVTDGDFESGVNRGIALYQSLDSYPTPSGNYAAMLYVNGTAGTEYTQQWNLPTPITLLANVEYTIEYDYSVAGTARGVASDYARDENSNWISGIMMEKSQHTLTGGQGVWKKYVNTFKLNQETVLSRLRFGFVLNGDGVGWKTIDNIKIYQGASIVTQFSNLTQEIDTIQATVASNEANTQARLIMLSDQITSTVGQLRDGNNLVDDGGFESGNGRGLSLIGQTDTYPTPSGNYMARLIKTGGTASEDYYQIWTLPTPITLLANTEYTIEYDYSVAGTARGNASDYLRTATGSWVSGVMMDHASHTLTGGQGVWKKYTKTFSLSAETTISAMRFGFILNGNGTGWKVIDNIKIYQGASTQSQITQLADRMNFRITNSDGSVTQIDLANKVISLSGEQVNITGNTYIENGVIKTAAIADAAITNAKIGNISANKVTTGELNAANVNIINLNASNIVSGELTGITIKSAANGSLFQVRGNDLYMQKANGDNLTMSTSGIYWYDSSGEILFQSSKKLTTSDIFGTAEYNAYLAAFNETRSVTYASALKGQGGVNDYTYVAHRASKIFANQMEINTGNGNPTHLYLKTSSADADVRVAVAGDGDISYARLRAGGLFGNFVSINTQTNAVQLYLQTADEVRVKNTGNDAAGASYKAVRASAFNTSSLAEYKTNIKPFDQSALDLIKVSTVYEYNLKSDLATQEIGLVIGDGYDIADIVVNGDGVSQYRMNSLAWKAIQELNQKIETLEQEIRVLQAA